MRERDTSASKPSERYICNSQLTRCERDTAASQPGERDIAASQPGERDTAASQPGERDTATSKPGERDWLVTSQLGTGTQLTFFTVYVGQSYIFNCLMLHQC